jgi:hypothetical protein
MESPKKMSLIFLAGKKDMVSTAEAVRQKAIIFFIWQ